MVLTDLALGSDHHRQYRGREGLESELVLEHPQKLKWVR